MKLRRTVLLLMGLAAAAGGVLVSALPAAAVGQTISSVSYTELCLQPVGGSIERGAAIVTELCNGSAAQKWVVEPVSGSIVHWVNVGSGLCLDARGGAANRTPVQQWTCNSISNENWESDESTGSDDPTMRLISRVSGTRSYCLDIPDGRDAPGVAMQIYRCNGTPTQWWWD